MSPIPNNNIIGQIYSLYSPPPLFNPAIKLIVPNTTAVLMK